MLKAVARVAAAVTIGGCATSGTMPPARDGLPQSSMRTAAQSVAGFTFYTVDFPRKSPNRITGIADNREIVGVYGGNGTKHPYHSYTSQYSSNKPYSHFQNDDYPNGSSTYMASINAARGSSSSIQAGYAIAPGDLQGDWGVINNQGLWTLIRRHRGEGKCHMMQLFGINSNYYAVGFYWYDESPPSAGCSKHTQKVTELRPGDAFHDFPHVLGANPVASGVAKSGWLLGSTDDSGPSQGWSKMVCKGCRKGTEVKYWNYKNARHLSTRLLGVNDSDVAVGTYQDARGNWHGLIAENLFSVSKAPKWQSIDEPDGNQTNTAISGIDDAGDICGWYTGHDRLTHGFVGIHQ